MYFRCLRSVFTLEIDYVRYLELERGIYTDSGKLICKKFGRIPVHNISAKTPVCKLGTEITTEYTDDEIEVTECIA
jgi:hypothetical protein